jgi:hypothetical protein
MQLMEKATPMKQCVECGDDFVPYRAWHRYCCAACRMARQRREYHQIREWWLRERERDEQGDEPRVAVNQ